MTTLTFTPDSLSFYFDAGKPIEFGGLHYHGEYGIKESPNFGHKPILGKIEVTGDKVKGIMILDRGSHLGNGLGMTHPSSEAQFKVSTEDENDFLTQVVGLKELEHGLLGLEFCEKLHFPEFSFYRHASLDPVTFTIRSKNTLTEFKGQPLVGEYRLIKIHTYLSGFRADTIPTLDFNCNQRKDFNRKQCEKIRKMIAAV